MNETISYESRGSEYYDQMISKTLKSIKSGLNHIGRFDCIMIDEGQDFNNNMIEIVMQLLKPDGDLLIALDDFQDVYRRNRSWKSLGIQAL